MANQTNVYFNPTYAPISVTLASATVVIPAQGKTADAGVTGTDAEVTALSSTALIWTKGPLSRQTREYMRLMRCLD